MTLFEVCEFIAKNGGATIKHRGGGEFEVVKRKRGYAVSLYGYEKAFIFTSIERLHMMILKYMRDNAEILKNRYYLGAWIDDGIVYLDIKIIIKNKVNALLRASLEKQKALYDFNKNKSIYVDDYKHLIDNIVLYEQVDKLKIIDELNPLYVAYSRQLNQCNAWLVCYNTNYGYVYIYYSYNTIIFIQLDKNLYFNRLNYSSATTQHIHKFMRDYNLKSLSWLQLIKKEWYSLIRQLNLSTQYGARSDYFNNELKWLINIEDITR